MVVAGEIPQLHDCLLINLDIEDSPFAEIPLVDVYDMVTSTLLDNHRETIHETITQILEDTMWVNQTMIADFVSASFSIFEVREEGMTISLRTPSLQRLISYSVSNRDIPIAAIQIPLLIRFKSPDKPLPTSPQTPSVPIRTGPPSNVSEAELLDQVSELPGISPVFQQPTRVIGFGNLGETSAETMTAPGMTGTEPILRSGPEPGPRGDPSSVPGNVPTFRGNPIDMDRRSTNPLNSNPRGGRDYDPFDVGRPPGNPTSTRRGLLFDHTVERTPHARTPTRSHPYSDEVTFGAETFQEYMSQFQFSEVKYKDFRKAVIPKFDASKNDSFVHWYKLLVSTCLQWGVWCPPYESVEEDNVYGCWWMMLPQSVRDQKSFMGHLLYSLLIKPETFPANSRELEAVEGSTANAGYNAIYNILRMHHPILHSVYSTANEIPRHRRSETFSLYLRRLQEFIARERLASRTYTESEALDLAVRNISTEWRSDFRRLVERDKSSGKGGTLPFKLALPQIATTFVEYADEIGREAPGSRISSSTTRSSPTAIMRRLETTHEEEEIDGAFMLEDDVDLIVNAIAQTQQSSSVCVGCQQPGHTLTDCNRFVDYIVAESLAQRHPALRAQIANSHSHFRSRLNAVNARARMTPHPPATRTIRSLQMSPSPPGDSPVDASPPPPAIDEDSADLGYRQHSIYVTGDDCPDDFESCFSHLSVHSVHILGVDDSSPVSAETVTLPEISPLESFSIRRLAETYDAETASVFAHADNGSMACTVQDAKLLFAYRPLAKPSVRLFDAGNHVHRPLGVGFLCIPTDARGIGGAPQFVFIRTFHTPTIPGVIISHSAISKQLDTSGYRLSSNFDTAGFIHFPHRLRNCQDVYITIQPISQRGGLTFTEALILPTDDQHSAPVPPWPTRVHRLCSDHSPDPLKSDIVDPTDGMHCKACHEPAPTVSNTFSCRSCNPLENPTPDFR